MLNYEERGKLLISRYSSNEVCMLLIKFKYKREKYFLVKLEIIMIINCVTHKEIQRKTY